MAYRKLGRDNKHRRSLLANQTKDVIMNERITTTETRAKEVRKFVDKMISYGKDGSLVARRKALAFLHNDTEAVKKVFDELAPRYQERNGGYTKTGRYTYFMKNIGINKRKVKGMIQERILELVK